MHKKVETLKSEERTPPIDIWDLGRLAQKVETLKSEWRTPPIEMQQRKLSMEEANFGIKNEKLFSSNQTRTCFSSQTMNFYHQLWKGKVFFCLGAKSKEGKVETIMISPGYSKEMPTSSDGANDC